MSVKPRETLSDPHSMTDAELQFWLAHGIAFHHKPRFDYAQRNLPPPTAAAAILLPTSNKADAVGNYLEWIA